MPDKSKLDDFIDRTDQKLAALDSGIYRLSLIVAVLAALLLFTNDKAARLLDIATAFAGGR